MGCSPVRLIAALALVAACTSAAPPALSAAEAPPAKTLFLGASLETQQLIRTPDPSTLQFIQQRNTVRLLADAHLVKDGHWQFPQGGSVPGVRNAHLFLLYRGVYDSAYDTLPSVPTKTDYRGVAVPAGFDNLNDLGRKTRDGLKFENRLREAYLDIELPEQVLVRLGRQQVVWGAADGFRVLDRINSLDLTWHQYQDLPPTDESFDEIRVPAWMLLVRKNGFDAGGGDWAERLRHWFAEVYWNPGDWHPNKVEFLPVPWGTMLVHPLVNPTTGQEYALRNGTVLFRQGDYHRNPADNSQVGVRLGTDRQLCASLTDCRLHGSIAYMYHRFTPWGGASTSAAPLFQVAAPDPLTGDLGLEFEAPYVHTAGVSLSWVPTLHSGITYPIPPEHLWHVGLRFESTVDFGVPFYFCGPGFEPVSGPARCRRVATTAALLPPTRSRDIWSGVVGSDVVWSRFRRIAVSGQFFWTYLLQDDARTIGSLDYPDFFGGSPGVGYRDDVRRWEALTTLTAATWFCGGRVRLSANHLLDWVNSYSQEASWALAYTITTGLVAELSQRFLINPSHEVNFEPWALAGLNRGRSETGLRLRYELPTLAY